MWVIAAVKIIWSVLSGGGLNGVMKEVGTYLGKVSDNKSAVQEAQIGGATSVSLGALQAHTQEWLAQVDLAKYRWGWWGERYLMLFAALGPVVHSNAVYLDCVPFWGHAVGSWGIAKAPGVYEGQEMKVIACVVGYSVARAGVAAVIGKFTGAK